MINDNVSSNIISKLVLQFDRGIDEVEIYHYSSNLSYFLLKETSDVPYGTPVERLIAEFNQKTDVRFCYGYALHYVDSGFVT